MNTIPFKIAINLAILLIINFISFKYFIKVKNIKKILFIIFLAIIETGILIYIDIFLSYRNTMFIVGILSIMTISDIEKMEVPEWSLIALPACSVLNFTFLCIQSKELLYLNIVTAVAVYIALTLLGKLYNDMLGGADIIMAACVALNFGIMQTLYMFIIGCGLSIVYMLIYSKIKRTKAMGVPLPFLPGLTIGFLLAFVFV